MPKRTAASMLSNNSQTRWKKTCYGQTSLNFLDAHSSHCTINSASGVHSISQRPVSRMVPTTRNRPPLHKVGDDTYDLIDCVETGHSNKPAGYSSSSYQLPFSRSAVSAADSVKTRHSTRSLVRKSSLRSPCTNTTDSGFYSITSSIPRSFISVTGTQLLKFLELIGNLR